MMEILHDYYKVRVDGVLTSDITTSNFLEGTYMIINRKENRYKKDKTVIKEIKIPIY